MGASTEPRRCHCGTRLASDNRGTLCQACLKAAQNLATTPPVVDSLFWRTSAMTEALASHDIGKVIRAYRTHGAHGRDISQEIVARWLGITQPRLSAIENGAPVNNLDRLTDWAEILAIPDDLTWFAKPRGVQVAEPASIEKYDFEQESWESTIDVLKRISRLDQSSLSDNTLSVVELVVDDVVGRYELEGPFKLAAETSIAQKFAYRALANGFQPERRRVRLLQTTAKLTGLLAYMAVNASKEKLALAYCAEATALADRAGDNDLRAWIRGTESLAFYYGGDYLSALDAAEDGTRYGSASQHIRLAVNGVARAAGKLGKRGVVEKAVDHAYTLLDREERAGASATLSPCISFEPYTRGRAAANAATAYLSVGQVDLVEQYINTVDTSGSSWSKTLMGLDAAAAALSEKDASKAMTLGVEAISASREHPIASAVKRGRELLTATRNVAGTQAVEAFEHELDQLARNANRRRDAQLPG